MHAVVRHHRRRPQPRHTFGVLKATNLVLDLRESKGHLVGRVKKAVRYGASMLRSCEISSTEMHSLARVAGAKVLSLKLIMHGSKFLIRKILAIAASAGIGQYGERLFDSPVGKAPRRLGTGCARSLGLKETTMLNCVRMDGIVPIGRDKEELEVPRTKQSRAETLQRAGKWLGLRLSGRHVNIDRVEAEFAHANRVATMGQLAASIAHEVKQPIAATVINAEAALGFLNNPTVNLDLVRQILSQIV